MERFFDIIFSGAAILILSPLLIPVLLILKLTGEGEIFFAQERIGKNGEIFRLFKFATMFKNSPNIGTGTVTTKDDPRVLPFGRFLRKSKINELPQLYNIFIGEMSIVGPRPLTPQTFNNYSLDVRNIISKVRPGLSGIGSIVFRNEDEILQSNLSPLEMYKNTISPYKGILETWYYNNKKLIFYFQIILITIWVVFFPRSKIIWRIFNSLPRPPKELINKIY